MAKYHLIGIGGIGMSGIAHLLLSRGDQVSGSDLRQSEITEDLKKRGASVTIGHKNFTVANEKPDFVVYSSAITDYSPGYIEIETAKQIDIPTLKRGQMIKELMKGKSGIAISGMHGKTTTTSMIGSMLLAAKLDPTVLVGGILGKIGSNARLGKGKYFVVEACEYDKTFLEFEYDRAIITNIEEEHMEYFGSIENIMRTFEEFVSRIPKEGLLIACGDNENVHKLLQEYSKPLITYGFDEKNDVKIKDVQVEDSKIEFNLESGKKELEGSYSLNYPGKHNVLNAAAAVILAKDLEIDDEIIREELNHFSGVKRRMEIYDKINDIIIMDDYAHHPTEIASTLEALREFYKDRRILVVFRPSQYSRNKALLSQYGKAFKLSDLAIIPRTYQPVGRDKEDKEIDSQRIVEEIEKNGQKALYLPEFTDVLDYLKNESKPNDLIVTMGLGPLYELTKEIQAALKEKYGK